MTQLVQIPMKIGDPCAWPRFSEEITGNHDKGSIYCKIIYHLTWSSFTLLPFQLSSETGDRYSVSLIIMHCIDNKATL